MPARSWWCQRPAKVQFGALAPAPDEVGTLRGNQTGREGFGGYVVVVVVVVVTFSMAAAVSCVPFWSCDIADDLLEPHKDVEHGSKIVRRCEAAKVLLMNLVTGGR